MNYRILFLAFFFQFAIKSSYAQQWTDVGSADFSVGQAHFPSVAFNPTTGNPYVAYIDNHNASYPTVMMYNGSSWSLAGGSVVTTHAASHTCLAFDNQGNAYVAYLDGVTNNVVVMESGTTWSMVLNTPVSAGSSTGISLAIDGNGVPYVAYIDAANSNMATVKQYTSTGWSLVGSSPASSGAVTSVSLALYTSGGTTTPYLAYADVTSSLPVVKQYNGTSWVTLGSSPLSTSQASPIIKLSPTGVPYVAYTDASTTLNAASVQVYNTSSNTWSFVGNPRFTQGSAGDISFAINANSIPYIAFVDGANSNKTTVMTCTNRTNWINVGSPAFTPGAGWDPSLALDANGVPYIAYMDASPSNYQMTVEKMAATITPAGSTTFCLGGSLVLNANVTTGTSYQWYSSSPGDPTETFPIAGATNSSYTATTQASQIFVTETNYGFTASSPVITLTEVSYPYEPSITPAGTASFCTGGSMALNTTSSANYTYQWYNGSNAISGATAASYTATTVGSYTVAITNLNTCTVTTPATVVTVNSYPSATITSPSPLCDGSTVLNGQYWYRVNIPMV